MFASLPRLLERAGNGARGGITGIYTVLVDGDDFNEPVADAARSILDGHIVLTRRLAGQNHFPAIDVLESKSRVRDQIVNEAQRRAGSAMMRLEAAYREKEDLIMVGAYQRGSDPYVDAAIVYRERVLEFLQQRPDEVSLFGETYARMTQLADAIEGGCREARLMFRFRLQRVLELREEREKAMAAELAAARTAADAARDQQASLEAVRDSSRGELHAANTAAPRIGHLQQLGLVLDSIDQRLQTATEQTQAAERAADTAQEALVVAARDRRILDPPQGSSRRSLSQRRRAKGSRADGRDRTGAFRPPRLVHSP